jgi:hypothetical protein
MKKLPQIAYIRSSRQHKLKKADVEKSVLVMQKEQQQAE